MFEHHQDHNHTRTPAGRGFSEFGLLILRLDGIQLFLFGHYVEAAYIQDAHFDHL